MLPSHPPACFAPNHPVEAPATTGAFGVCAFGIADGRGDEAFHPAPPTPFYRLIIAPVRLPVTTVYSWLGGRI
jgi:hypothetical protein